MKNLRIIKNWGVVSQRDISPDIANATRTFCGNVFNHPKHQDGTRAATSSPCAYDPNLKVFRTVSGGLYRLDAPEAKYAEMFPSCEDRIHEMLSKLKLITLVEMNDELVEKN